VLHVENVPCEFYYINHIAKTKYADTTLIKSVHDILYNEELKAGWLVLRICNQAGRYLFSHTYPDRIFSEKKLMQ